MQKLHIESRVPADIDTTWELFESERFRDRLSKQTGLVAELLDTTHKGNIEVRRFRYTSSNDLPAVAAKALGMPRLAYEQVNSFDKAANRLDWIIEMPVMTDRIKVSGITTMKPAAGGCLRVVDGTIEVKMRLIGGQIEKAVVAEFDKSMRRVVDLAIEMIKEEQA